MKISFPRFILFLVVGLIIGLIYVKIGANKVGAPYYPKDWNEIASNLPAILLIATAFTLFMVFKFGRMVAEDEDPEKELRAQVYQLWRKMPILEKIKQEMQRLHPEITDKKIAEAISRSQKLNDAAYAVAEKYRSKVLTKVQGINELKETQPGFPSSLYRKAWNNGMLESMH